MNIDILKILMSKIVLNRNKHFLINIFFHFLILLKLFFSLDVLAFDEIVIEDSFTSFGGSSADEILASTRTADNGIVFVGSSMSNDTIFNKIAGNSYNDATIVKYDENLNLQWANNIGGTLNSRFWGVAEDVDGSLYVAGNTNSTINGVASNGGWDGIIGKYTSEGKLVWLKNFGGSAADSLYAMTLTSDDAIIAVGYSASKNLTGITNLGGWDAYIVKCDKNGKEIWSRTFGGSLEDVLYSVKELSSGDIIVSGSSASTDGEYDSFSTSDYNDAIIAKYDKDGNKIWIKSFGGSKHDRFWNTIETKDKDIICIGWSSSTDAGFTNKGAADAIVVKYDKNGNKLWAKNYGGSKDEIFYEVGRESSVFQCRDESPSLKRITY
jgi:hypothetical protein